MADQPLKENRTKKFNGLHIFDLKMVASVGGRAAVCMSALLRRHSSLLLIRLHLDPCIHKKLSQLEISLLRILSKLI